MKLSKSFSIGTGVYIFLFLIDYVIELFQINKSGNKMTIFGLKINTLMTPHTLNTNFELTYQALFIYFAFIMFWLMITYLLKRKYGKNNA